MTTILMPMAGKAAQDGTIVRWLKSAGQPVAKGEVLFEMETEEGRAQVESAVAGTLAKILVPQGRTAAVGAPIAEIQEAQAAPAPAAPPPPPVTPAAPPAAPSGAVTPILMPKAGQSMEEGTIVKWRVKPGDRIEKGQIIFEIETDKAVVEVEATDSGRLAKIILPEGGVSPVLQPVAYLAASDADVAAVLSSGTAPAAPAPVAAAPAAPAPAPAAPPRAAAPVDAGGRVKASPAARKLAEERGLNLAAVGAGSGPGGRILSTDLPAAGKAAPAPAASGDVVRKRMSKMRKAIGAGLLFSKQNFPHFYARVTVNADALFAFYKEQKPATNCTLNDLVTLACARVVREMPAFRSRIEGDEIVEFPGVHLGVAVGIEDGLVVPVLQNADRMTLADVVVNTRRIVENARAGKLEGVGKGCMTITNLGMFGVEDFSPIINPPEPAIVAVGALREGVLVKDGAIRAGRLMSVTLSCDHRIVDGVLAAKFLARLKEILESPRQLA
jgi:pyruvate dehydrogenase E2 component (dihydrolipoamide acetyltransferase)